MCVCVNETGVIQAGGGGGGRGGGRRERERLGVWV